jgi:hypothetical protein
VPSKNLKQHRFMEAVAHNSKFAKKAGIPQSVGKDFAAADKGKSFNKGGEMAKKPDLKSLFKGKDTKSEELKEAKAIKSGKITPMQYAKGEKMEDSKKMKCGGSVKKMASGGLTSRGDGVASKGKTKCKVI